MVGYTETSYLLELFVIPDKNQLRVFKKITVIMMTQFVQYSGIFNTQKPF